MADWSRASRRARDPARLAQATLYLPTLRAGRMAREIFLDELKTDAVVLPRIVALGDIDEDELAFAEDAEPGGIAPLEIPPQTGRAANAGWCWRDWSPPGPNGPVLSPLVVGGPASTLALAGDLARLMDDMVTRGVDWSALDRLVPDQFDKYWQHTLDFLKIARDVLAGFSRRNQPDRARRAPRPFDRCRSRAPDQAITTAR